MSLLGYANQNQTLSGIITISDGEGTTISGGTITTENLNISSSTLSFNNLDLSGNLIVGTTGGSSTITINGAILNPITSTSNLICASLTNTGNMINGGNISFSTVSSVLDISVLTSGGLKVGSSITLTH